MKKNLVIGSGRGYSWNIFEPFVRSFLKFVPSAELVLFVEDISDFTRYTLETVSEGRIKLEPFPADLQGGFVINDRWEMFLRYIEEHDDEYEQIFITDTRDVIFQDDVFKYFAAEKNFIGYATEYDTILSTKTPHGNYKWLVEYFNKETADKFADKEIICCGTIIGTPEEMKIFLRAMVKYNPHHNGHGEDQVTMQYIIYNNLLQIENLIKSDCDSGAMLTAGLFQMCTGVKVEDGMILRGNGGVPAVVHQYDWQVPLYTLINFLYREKIFHFDENFTDTHSALDQFIQLTHVENFEEAAKIFYKYLLGKTNFENLGEKLLRFWAELLQINPPPLTPEWEIIEISLQHALIFGFSKGVSFSELPAILNSTNKAQTQGRPVSAVLKASVYQAALNFVNVFFQRGKFQDAKILIENLEKIGCHLGKDFYILKAGVYQELRQYMEAEAAYKKAKEFEKR